MRFSALALAALAVPSAEARDPKYAPKATSPKELKAMKPDFVYPNLNEIGTKAQEDKSKEEHTVIPKYIFDPSWFAPHYVVPHVYHPPYIFVPPCPTLPQFLNPKYIAKLHNRALRKRYLWARNQCKEKYFSSRKRYKCF
jgi:hypothetical protein